MAKLAAVIPSRGLGDGLIMMVASHLLSSQGYIVTTYHDQLIELRSWFPDHRLQPTPPIEALLGTFSPFDLVIVQYDHHRLEIPILLQFYQRGKISNLSVFYPSKQSAGRENLTIWDQVFNEQMPMVDNVAISISSLFQIRETSKNNGLIPPLNHHFRKNPQRILIHPTRSDKNYRWPAQKFIQTGEILQNLGYEISFILSPNERPLWEHLQEKGFSVPRFSHLSHLSSYTYESALLIGNDSGPAHLASNLQIPTLVIANCAKRMKLWRPAWLQGKVMTPPGWVPNTKGLRIREKYWDRLISPKQVVAQVLSLLSKKNAT